MFVVTPDGDVLTDKEIDPTCYILTFPGEMYELPTKTLVALLKRLTGRDVKKLLDRRQAEMECWGALIASGLTYNSKKSPSKEVSFKFDPRPIKRYIRPGTKRFQLVELLRSGASFDDICLSMGWNKRQATEGIRLLNSYSGYGLREENGLIYLYE